MEELAPNAPLPDIDDIVAPLAPTGNDWLVYAMVGGALLAVLALVFFLSRRRKGGPHNHDYDPFRSAMDQLHALKEEYTRVPANIFALRTSHALREYLFAAHDPNAPYETSEELLRSLEVNRENPLPADALAELRALLTDCDLMQYSPEEEASRLRLGVVEGAIHFLREDHSRRASATTASPQNSNPEERNG